MDVMAADGIKALTERTVALLSQGDGPGALVLCCRMLEDDIGHAPAYRFAGLALELMGADDGALASYRHASHIAPASAEPLGDLALLHLQRGDRDEALAAAGQALARDPREGAATLALAKLAFDQGLAEDAARRLTGLAEPLLSPPRQALAQRVLGDALDALGRPADAFEAYEASAAIFRRQFAASCAGPEPMAGLDLCRRLRDAYRQAPPELWSPAPGGEMAGADPGGAAGHVFVVGYPRSGTTLLEQVLATHPKILALEEQATLMPSIDAYLDPPTGVDALGLMDEQTAERWRRDYWARVRSFGVEPAGKVFVDKQPFYTLWLPLIGKLFPHARIVVVRRDPRDLVFSCFRKPFRMTPVTYELMTLERSAALYAAAMDILELFLERSPSRRIVYRHEDLVTDFDGVAGRICDVLDLDWSDRLRDFAATARARQIRTPSASQVVRGLNRDGIGAWRPYEAMLAPIMPVLAPLARAYGYPA